MHASAATKVEGGARKHASLQAYNIEVLSRSLESKGLKRQLCHIRNPPGGTNGLAISPLPYPAVGHQPLAMT